MDGLFHTGHTMAEEIRFYAALAAARKIAELFANRVGAETPERLSQITYTVLGAIYESEERLASSGTPAERGNR